MSRHRMLTALVLLAGLALLPACSTGSPAGNAVIKVGGVVHIGGYTQVFAPLPANPAQAAVMEGFREGQVLWSRSEQTWRLAPTVRDYVTGQALRRLAIAMKATRQQGFVEAGTDRFFMTRVAAITAHSALVTTCDNGSGFRQVIRRTGKVDTALPVNPATEYLFESWGMVRVSGHWAITSIAFSALPSRSAEHCQPGITGSGPSVRPDVAVLLRQTAAAVRAASGFHLSGSVRRGGETFAANVDETRSDGLFGQIALSGTEITVLVTHGHGYLKLTASYLRTARLPATACSRYCGKYLRFSALQTRALVSGLNMAVITHPLAEMSASHLRCLGAVTVSGQVAWLLEDSQDNSVYIAAHGRPYILREAAAVPDQNTVTMTRWNAVRIPAAPAGNQIVTFSQLAG